MRRSAAFAFFVILLSLLHEFLQLGMLGTSVLYSSGDDGVAGGNGLCLNSEGLSIFISSNFGFFDWVFKGMSLDQGQDLILASLYATIITLKTISSQCIYRLPVHSLLLLGPPRSTQDQPLMIQKAHANKLFFLEEDSLTSLRKGFTI